MVKKMLLLHAHPDDEAITTGGLIHFARSQGAQVLVVTATAGECGEVLNSQSQLSGAALAALRASELAQALLQLGSPDHRWLGSFGKYWDSGMAGDSRNQNPAALMNQPLTELVNEFSNIVGDFKPDLVVTYEPGGGYGHPDHKICNQIVQESLKSMPIPVLYPVYPVERKAELARLALAKTAFFGEVDLTKMSFLVPSSDIDFELTAHPAKLSALLSYRSQIDPSGEFYDQAVLGDLTGIDTEYFQLANREQFIVIDRTNPLLGLGLANAKT